MKKIITFSFILLAACNSKTVENKTENTSQTPAKDSMNVVAVSLDSVMVDNKKDPIWVFFKSYFLFTTSSRWGFCPFVLAKGRKTIVAKQSV